MATFLSGLAEMIPFSARLPESIIRQITGGDNRGYSWLAGAFLSWMQQEQQDRQAWYVKYRDYYDGEHKIQLTDRMKEFLELVADVKFDLNYIPLAVDVLAERLTVLGFSGEEGVGGHDGALAGWWAENALDAIQNDVHLSALRDGDTYVMVGWDNEEKRPIITHEMAYDGTSGAHVVYHTDQADTIRMAFKQWVIEGTGADQRLNVYLPNVIFKFVTTRDGWDRYLEDGVPWPLPWIDESTGEGLGVPIFHFRNKGNGWLYGKSELHDLIPVQDALNKMVLDEIGGADIEGFGMITLSGGRPPADDIALGPRKILHAPDGVWGEIKAGNLMALSDMVHNYIVRMAQISRTPLQYFQSTKQIASGETQQAYDAGIISKAEHRSKFYGRTWVAVMQMAMNLDNTYGSGSWSDEQMKSVKSVWGTFERVDRLDTEKKRSDIVARLVESGTSLQGALMVAGYSTEEIDNLLEGAPLVAPIFLKAGGVGRAEAGLLTGDATNRELSKAPEGSDDIAPAPARAE